MARPPCSIEVDHDRSLAIISPDHPDVCVRGAVDGEKGGIWHLDGDLPSIRRRRRHRWGSGRLRFFGRTTDKGQQ